MSLDYSEICIGSPNMVIDKMIKRLGQLNFSSRNIRIGITDDPDYTFREMGGHANWALMKLLYVTRSFAKALEMSDLLRSYDGKLFVNDEQAQQAGPHSSTYYAYALIR